MTPAVTPNSVYGPYRGAIGKYGNPGFSIFFGIFGIFDAFVAVLGSGRHSIAFATQFRPDDGSETPR